MPSVPSSDGSRLARFLSAILHWTISGCNTNLCETGRGRKRRDRRDLFGPPTYNWILLERARRPGRRIRDDRRKLYDSCSWRGRGGLPQAAAARSARYGKSRILMPNVFCVFDSQRDCGRREEPPDAATTRTANIQSTDSCRRLLLRSPEPAGTKTRGATARL